MKLATVSPTPTNPKVIKIMIGKDSKRLNGVNGIPNTNPSPKTIIPWINASVLSPNILPKKTDRREIGATSISFKKPNSLSHMTDMPMNIEVNRSVCPTIPGKIYS
jgi:hypothetical protein